MIIDNNFMKILDFVIDIMCISWVYIGLGFKEINTMIRAWIGLVWNRS